MAKHAIRWNRRSAVLLAATLLTTGASAAAVSDWPLQFSSASGVDTLSRVQAVSAPKVTVQTVHRFANTAIRATPATNAVPQRRITLPPRPVATNDQQRLFDAVLDNDIERVRKLLRSPQVDVNAPYSDQSRNSLIDIAAQYALTEISALLIEKGAHLHAGAQPEPIDIHPIGSAMLSLTLYPRYHDGPGALIPKPTQTTARFEDTMHALLEAGASPEDIADPSVRLTSLGYLATSPRFDGDLRIARLLLDHGAVLDESPSTDSALVTAAAYERDDLVTLMLSANRSTRNTLTGGLQQAASKRNLLIVEKLLSAGADPNAIGNSSSPLLCESLESVSMSRQFALALLAHDANANATCRRDTPLILAINDAEVVRALLEHGADPNVALADGATALTRLSSEDHELVDLLLTRGARLGFTANEAAIYRQNGVSLDPITWSILHHQDYLAARLIQRNGTGSTNVDAAVVYAANAGCVLALTELLKRGADPNSESNLGITALMAATHNNQIETLRTLLQQPRIRVDQATPRQINPRFFAIYSETEQHLLFGHRTALMFAASVGRVEALQLLLAHGADPSKKDAAGQSAIDYASSPGARQALLAAVGQRRPGSF